MAVNFCGNCGSKIEGDNKFCQYCGAEIKRKEITPQPVPITPQEVRQYTPPPPQKKKKRKTSSGVHFDPSACEACGACIVCIIAIAVAIPLIISSIAGTLASRVNEAISEIIPGFEPFLLIGLFSISALIIILSYHFKIKKNGI